MTPTDTFTNEIDAFVSEVWQEIQEFLAETGTAPSMFCKAAVNDPNLIKQIRQGKRRLTVNMAVRLRRYMEGKRREMETP